MKPRRKLGAFALNGGGWPVRGMPPYGTLPSGVRRRAWTHVDPPQLLVVLNPCVVRGRRGSAWARAAAGLRALSHMEVRETLGDGADVQRITDWLSNVRPAIAVAAGGDGTVRAVAAALMAVPLPARPTLGLLPLGTANNVARSLGLSGLHCVSEATLARVARAIVAGAPSALDVGYVDGAPFVGSFALGMDGEILAARNRWQRRYGLDGGYALYLLSCAANLTRHRSVRARLAIDAVRGEVAVYNLLVLNTALYAGEFRFGGAARSADGRLDVHVFTGAVDYVRRYTAAWRRQLAHRGAHDASAPGVRCTDHLAVELERPLASQLDGEEGPRGTRFTVWLEPAALRVCLPADPRRTVG